MRLNQLRIYHPAAVAEELFGFVSILGMYINGIKITVLGFITGKLLDVNEIAPKACCVPCHLGVSRLAPYPGIFKARGIEIPFPFVMRFVYCYLTVTLRKKISKHFLLPGVSSRGDR